MNFFLKHCFFLFGIIHCSFSADEESMEKFKKFIGLPDKVSAQNSAVAIIEGAFSKTQLPNVIEVSPKAQTHYEDKKAILEKPLEIYLDHINISKSNDLDRCDLNPQITQQIIHFIELGTEEYQEINSSANAEKNRITIQKIQFRPDLTFERNSRLISLNYSNFPLLEDYSAHKNDQNNNKELLSQNGTLSELSETDKVLVKPYLEIIAKDRDCLREHVEKERENINHSESVIKSFLMVAPDAKLKCYEVTELDKVAADPEIQIVSISAMLSHFHYSQDYVIEQFDVFNNTGKIVLLAISNNHQPITLDPNDISIKILERSQGYYPILCSSSSYLRDDLLGNVGNYLTIDDNSNLKDFYMTAPGVAIDLFADQEISSGCSLSAPFIAGGVAILKSRYPDASNEQITQALIQGGRKRPCQDSIFNDNENLGFNHQARQFIENNVNEDFSDFSEHEKEAITQETLQFIENNTFTDEKDFSNYFNNNKMEDRKRLNVFKKSAIFKEMWTKNDYKKYYNHLDIKKSIEILETLTSRKP